MEINRRSNRKYVAAGRVAMFAFFVAALVAATLMLAGGAVRAQSGGGRVMSETESLRVGERISYALSLDGFGNVGQADLTVVSRGTLMGRDAFEVRLKMKTFDVVNAAFFPVDEVRTAYLDSASGLPFALKTVTDPQGFSQESIEKFPTAPSGLDLIALAYKVRRAGGVGRFRLTEDGANFWVDMKARDGGRIKTEAGSYNTTVSTVRSAYFKSIGLSDVKVYLSNDDARVPVLVSFRTSAGVMSARLTSFKSAVPAANEDAATAPNPTPVPVVSPPRPKPTPVKVPYVDNQPLGGDLPFALGERMTFGIKAGQVQVGKVVFEARERKQVDGKDSLLLIATVTEAAGDAGIFTKDDYIKAQVNPGSILPNSSEARFKGSLSELNAIAKFDQEAGTATPSGSSQVTMPSNTHTILSLVYAVRTFSLKPSKTPGNPVMDTRVSVFWNNQALVFTIRPMELQNIDFNGSKVTALLVSVITGNPQLDALSPKVWLTNDASRLPVRIALGNYTAELIPRESRAK